MAATVAHEINNPLEAVTNLMYLAKGGAIDEDARDYLATMEQELARISQVTKQTLGFYREATAPSALRVGPMLDQLISVLVHVCGTRESRFARKFGGIRRSML